MALDRKLIRAGTTVDQMVRAIADEILTGKLRPGDRLDEASLAERYGVSRTPVRDALGQLSAMSLVDRRPNRGAIVMVMTQDHLASMFESMAELEAICARFSAERMTPAERAALESVHYASRNLVRGNAEEAYDAYNFHFHTRLYEGAHNTHIRDLAMMTRSRLAPFRRAQFRLRGRLMKSWKSMMRSSPPSCVPMPRTPPTRPAPMLRPSAMPVRYSPHRSMTPLARSWK